MATETPDLLSLAHAARENGNHYKGFKVGCVGVGKNGEIYLGANYKPVQNMEPTCAEEQVMLQAMADEVMLTRLIVVGQPRVEDTTPTLHCCGERCRPRMRMRYKQGKAVTADTQILCVHSVDTNVQEQFTLRSLLAHHGESLDD